MHLRLNCVIVIIVWDRNRQFCKKSTKTGNNLESKFNVRNETIDCHNEHRDQLFDQCEVKLQEQDKVGLSVNWATCSSCTIIVSRGVASKADNCCSGDLSQAGRHNKASPHNKPAELRAVYLRTVSMSDPVERALSLLTRRILFRLDLHLCFTFPFPHL